jgi:eukaryotic-like serine/threonine-protein kinase
VWLAADDADTARRRLDDAMNRWTWEGFHWQHCTGFFARSQIELYVDDPAAAWKRVAETWPNLKRSLLLRVRSLRVTAHHVRARVALAQSAPSVEQLAAARTSAAILEREGMASATGLSRLVRAGLASHAGDVERTIAWLASAIEALDEAEMKGYAASARWRRGAILGGDEGKAELEAARVYFANEGICAPDRHAAMLVPLRAHTS